MGFSIGDIFNKGRGALSTIIPGGGGILAATNPEEFKRFTGSILGGPQPTEGTGFSSLPQTQQDMLNQMFSEGGNLLGRLGPTPEQESIFRNMQAGPISPEQRAAAGNVGQIRPELGQAFGALPTGVGGRQAGAFQGLQGSPITQQQQQTFGALNQGIGPLQAGGLQQTAQGGGFNNPYLEAQFKRGAGLLGEEFRNIIQPGIAAQASRAGRLGSPAEQAMQGRAEGAVGRSLSDFATGIFGPAAEAERQRQFQAQGLLPQLGLQQQGLGLQQRGQAFGAAGDISRQIQGGKRDVFGAAETLAGREDLRSGARFDAATNLQDIYRQGGMDQFNVADTLSRQNYGNLLDQYGMATGMAGQPFQNLQTLAGVAGTNPVRSPQQFNNPGAGALGGALGGAQIGSMFGPWGTAIGAVGGGILGSR